MKTKLLIALAAGVAASALAVASSAGAAVTFSFTDAPAASPETGYTVINDFSTSAGITGSGFFILNPPASSTGAPPANGDGSSYLAVTGTGTAEIDFAATTSFEFDWGSLDSYNNLEILSSDGTTTVIPGTTFTNPADGNQTAPGTNGLFRVIGTGTTTFTGIVLTNKPTTNSFEIDNLAVINKLTTHGGVPEPASWALMIMGFGAAGAMLRSNKRRAALA